NGRGPCQYRNLCHRGCPFGGYFSANASTIPAAEATGNMTLRPHSVVHSIIYDEQKGRAVGVRVIDAQTKEATEFYARIIFVNAGTLNTTLILLNSTSSRFPTGLGNDSGVLGHYLMDHNYRGRVSGEHEGFQDKYYSGRKPGGWYWPGSETSVTTFRKRSFAGTRSPEVQAVRAVTFRREIQLSVWISKRNSANPESGVWASREWASAFLTLKIMCASARIRK